MSNTPIILKTEITVEQGKSINTDDIGRQLAQNTKLVVMVIFQQFENWVWTPFQTSFMIDSHDNIFKQIDHLTCKAKSVEWKENDYDKSEYIMLINSGASDATQMVCKLYNLDIKLFSQFLKNQSIFNTL